MRIPLLIAVLAALALGVFFWLRGEGTAASPVVREGVQRVQAVGVPHENMADPVLAEPERTSEGRAELATEVATPAVQLARVHGRCVLAGGRPAAGVDVRMHGWQANQERVIQHGLPEQFESPSTTTDADGQFVIELDPPRAYQFTCSVSLRGYVGADWRWSEILPGADMDLGTIELRPGSTVLVRMENATGEPIRSGWMIYGESASRKLGRNVEPIRRQVALDAATGIARLEDLPPGPVALTAYSQISNWIDGPTVEAVAHGEVEAVIRYTGPDESHRIVVVPFTRPFYTQNVDASAIHLVLPDGRRPSQQIEGSSQSYAFDDLPPGRYSVEIEDPRYEPWFQHGVEPGTRVNARLRGAAGVQIEVLDSESDAVIPRYDLRLQFDNSRSFPNEFQLLAPTKEPPTDGIFAGLPATEITLVLAAEGYSKLELPLGQLVAGESRRIVARLLRGATLRGRVVLQDGRTPVPNAQVRVTASGGPAEMVSQWLTFGQAPAVWTTSDATGGFELSGLSPGRLAVHGTANLWLSTTLDPVELGAAEVREVVLALPASGRLRGRLLLPQGASCEGMTLRMEPTTAPALAMRFMDRFISLELQPDGSFEAASLPLGEAQLSLHAPDLEVPFTRSSGTVVDGPDLELPSVVIGPGRTTEIEVDLRERWYGSLRALVTRGGATMAGILVEVKSSDPEALRSSAGVTGEDGTATIPYLTPGEWTVTARAVDAEWSVSVAGTVHVASGSEAHCSLNVVLASGGVQFVDRASGTPLTHFEVHLKHVNSSIIHPYTTDEEGRLVLELTPGTYEFSQWPATPPNTALLEWTERGPATAEVALDRR